MFQPSAPATAVSLTAWSCDFASPSANISDAPAMSSMSDIVPLTADRKSINKASDVVPIERLRLSNFCAAYSIAAPSLAAAYTAFIALPILFTISRAWLNPVAIAAKLKLSPLFSTLFAVFLIAFSESFNPF